MRSRLPVSYRDAPHRNLGKSGYFAANRTNTRTDTTASNTDTDTRMAREIRPQIIMDASRMASRIRAIWAIEARDIAVEWARKADAVPLADV